MSSHYEPAPEDARRPIGHSVSDSLAASTDPDLPTVHADSVKLSADEDALLGIFRARVGQMPPAERLCELLAEVRAAATRCGRGGRHRAAHGGRDRADAARARPQAEDGRRAGAHP